MKILWKQEIGGKKGKSQRGGEPGMCKKTFKEGKFLDRNWYCVGRVEKNEY